MKFKEIKDVPAKELELKLRQNRQEQMSLRQKKSAGQVEKPHMFKLLRKDAARILTALNQKRAGMKQTAAVAAPVKKETKQKFKKLTKKEIKIKNKASK